MRRVVSGFAVLHILGTLDVDGIIRAGDLDTTVDEWVAVNVGNIVPNHVGRGSW